MIARKNNMGLRAAGSWYSLSLVPRPFPPPVFDRLQSAITAYLHTVRDQILAVGMAWERGRYSLFWVAVPRAASQLAVCSLWEASAMEDTVSIPGWNT